MHRVAADVWQFDGFPADAINVYLAGDVLIDAGTRWALPGLLTQLKGREISLLALTHCHPDHMGSAHALLRRFRVPLACHEEDVAATEGRRPMLRRDSAAFRLMRPLLCGPPCRVDRILRDGDTVGGFRVVATPGHTPGHVCYFRESDRVCIAGDVLANIHFVSGRPGLREPPRAFSHDPARNRRSMRTLLDLRPSRILFGHGPPLDDLRQLEEFVDRLSR